MAARAAAMARALEALEARKRARREADPIGGEISGCEDLGKVQRAFQDALRRVGPGPAARAAPPGWLLPPLA